VLFGGVNAADEDFEVDAAQEIRKGLQIRMFGSKIKERFCLIL